MTVTNPQKDEMSKKTILAIELGVKQEDLTALYLYVRVRVYPWLGQSRGI